MKMRFTVMVALLALSGTAFASGFGNGGDGGDALALQGQGQAQGQGQLQGQAQGQGQLQGQGQAQQANSDATSIALAGAAAGAAVVDSGNSSVRNSGNNTAQGGTALAGAAVLGSGNADVDVNSRNSNDNANLNLNRNVANGGESIQGQQQGNVNVVGVRGSEQSQTIAEGAVQNSTETSTSTDQSQSQSATATNAGNTQSITYNEATDKTVRNKGTVEVRSVPTAIAPNVYPTASCAMSASVGASALGWGVSGGGTKVNEECMQLEGARMFSQLGYPIQGIILACSTKSAIAVFGSAQKCVDAGIPAAATASQPIEVALVAAQPVKVETTVPYGK